MCVKAVVFDLDGTLVSFNLDYRGLRAEVRGFLMNAGVPASVLSLKETIFEMLKKTEIFMKNSGKTAEAMQEIRRKVLAIAEKYELEAAKTTSLLPGAEETLKALRRTGLKIGLCTISGEKSANYVLERFNIAGFFDVVVPRDKVDYVKPSPGHLGLVLEALEAAPEETIVVGDSGIDMQSARELKAIAVGLPTGVSSMEQLMGHGADYVITSITDLPILIEKINKAQAEQ
ncbi:MAG: HAD family hydrolase [Candidatus Bathyarchaeota archaeon]|nr:HAD family hydrolase [Candidatus Bathyarchaeota archaeon]